MWTLHLVNMIIDSSSRNTPAKFHRNRLDCHVPRLSLRQIHAPFHYFQSHLQRSTECNISYVVDLTFHSTLSRPSPFGQFECESRESVWTPFRPSSIDLKRLGNSKFDFQHCLFWRLRQLYDSKIFSCVGIICRKQKLLCNTKLPHGTQAVRVFLLSVTLRNEIPEASFAQVENNIRQLPLSHDTNLVWMATAQPQEE
jgi:hypothetical protein